MSDFKPPPEPVILHGDLWSGNIGYDKSRGLPIIFDPSSYSGHGEADLGIARMLAVRSSCATDPDVDRVLGLSKEFYDTYHIVHPRSEPYHEERQQLYELYHHLNVSSPADYAQVRSSANLP